MALAETVYRKINKLGIIPKLIHLLPKLSFIFAALSVAWLCYLPLDGNYRNVYISENALMPAQVTSYFRESEWNVVRGYREEFGKLENLSLNERNSMVESWLKDLNLQVSYHNNQTLYSIMHAPRGENTEAMALVVPWFNSDKEYNEGALSLALALIRYFNKMSIWSKNIILIFPENSGKVLRSWVEAYHTTLDETAGSIEAAIIMEYGKQGDYFNYYQMFYEGLNGQLPNLDLLNTANLISSHEGISKSIQGYKDNLMNFNTRLNTLFKGILKLSLTGLTNDLYGCEAFSGWQIQAFTIKAVGSAGHDVTQFGRIVDSTFRSVNNLLEKFHQSFFFYLMLSPKNFVSIGTYLPSAVLLAVSFALSSLSSILNNIKVEMIFDNLTFFLNIIAFVEIGCLIIAFTLPNTQFFEIGMSLLGVISLLPNFEFKNNQFSFALISISLFFISLLITALLIVHFSLAFIIGLLGFPLTFIPTLLKQRKVKIAKLISIISNPFFIIYIGSRYLEHPEIYSKLLTSWNDLQCWTWFIVMLGWFPSWILITISIIGYKEVDEIKKDI
ncbi:unnamed protein product [Candida verbasci]|uniref:GPI transamidase component GAA1 n=1 Tax=Candida verbasci TaxID=1227364 RepID=A0A9W4TYR2_9ASCO|nr:unnamed protein product [Candida verbasci]